MIVPLSPLSCFPLRLVGKVGTKPCLRPRRFSASAASSVFFVNLGLWPCDLGQTIGAGAGGRAWEWRFICLGSKLLGVLKVGDYGSGFNL